MPEGGVSVTYHTALSKPEGLEAQASSPLYVHAEVWPPLPRQHAWGRPAQGLRAVGIQGFRWLQFPVLLMR
ncbi:MAG: hypothetical protein FJZ47_21030, partial [Candidatus Tectomicrobia bacterium]|nr:hypothetical protein [Candidatus Tectomicrobia bacterium]